MFGGCADVPFVEQLERLLANRLPVVAQRVELAESRTFKNALSGTAENRYVSALSGARKVQWSVSCRVNLWRTRPRKWM